MPVVRFRAAAWLVWWTSSRPSTRKKNKKKPHGTAERTAALLPTMIVIVGARPRFETGAFHNRRVCAFSRRFAEARPDDPRQGIELMERRRRGQGPFKRGGAGAPGIGPCRRFADKGQNHVGEEDEHHGREDVGA